MKGVRGTYRYNEENKTLFKFIASSKAILWKTRELSLPVHVVDEMIPNLGADYMAFVDKEKAVRYTIPTDSIRRHSTLKQVGQEPQYYIRLEYFLKKDYTEPIHKMSDEVVMKDVDVRDYPL